MFTSVISACACGTLSVLFANSNFALFSLFFVSVVSASLQDLYVLNLSWNTSCKNHDKFDNSWTVCTEFHQFHPWVHQYQIKMSIHGS